MKNMDNLAMRQRLISGLLAALSVTSLALLRLQVWVSAVIGSRGGADSPEVNSHLMGWLYYSWLDVVEVSLVLSLALTAIVALLSLRLSKGLKAPSDVSDGATAVAGRLLTKLQGTVGNEMLVQV